jgi:L-alanine-DL-glutamate epimerase-like enolase superfamily enzyme
MVTAIPTVYGWIGGDRPSDVMEQAKQRKAMGFTAVKMNAVESVREFCPTEVDPADEIHPSG